MTDTRPVTTAPVELPQPMLDRFRRLASVRGAPMDGVARLVVEAMERGVATFESEAPPRLGPPTPPSPVLGLSGGESASDGRRIVRREGKLTFGSRDGDDRREVFRGGRRTDDRREVRRALVDRVLAEVQAGTSPRAIAEGLAADKLTTAGGKPWTAAAIQQLVRLEMDRRAHAAWTPTALRTGEVPIVEPVIPTLEPEAVEAVDDEASHDDASEDLTFVTVD